MTRSQRYAALYREEGDFTLLCSVSSISLKTKTSVWTLLAIMNQVLEKLPKNEHKLCEFNALLLGLMDNKSVTLDDASVTEVFGLLFKVYLKRCHLAKRVNQDSEVGPFFSAVEHFLLLLTQKGQARSVFTEAASVAQGMELPLLQMDKIGIEVPQQTTAARLMSPMSTKRHQQQSTMVESPHLSADFYDRVPDERNDQDSGSDIGDRLEAIVDKHLTFMVDQTELYLARIDALKTIYSSSVEINLASQSVPLMVVPKVSEASANHYKKAIKVDVANEKGFKSGIFGWCFMCRMKADFYCKDTRVSICGLGCKQTALSFLEEPFQALTDEPSPDFLSKPESKNSTKPCSRRVTSVTEYLFDILAAEISAPQSTDLVISSLADCLFIILDKVSQPVAESVEFSDLLKSKIVNVVGTFLLLSSPKLSKKAASIALTLVRRFRNSLKAQVYSILDGIILKSLEGPFLMYEHRQIVQSLLFSILSDKLVVGDIFLNYDCQRGYGDLLEHCFTVIGSPE